MRSLVTGGAGFIGAALVKALVADGNQVRVLDDLSRGDVSALPTGVEMYEGDIRNQQAVMYALDRVDEVIHLAYINGTETFYKAPQRVLDVAVRGMLNVLEGCKINNVRRMMLASSSEVCRADIDGMDEAIPLVIPDPFNPRYSYSAGKIISEMMAIHSGLFDWLTIFRPFNIYGPGMSQGHVIPDFKEQLQKKIRKYNDRRVLPFEMIGSSDETRSFCYIDDFIDGLMTIRKHGKHLGIYNVGTPEETSIGDLARTMGSILGYDLLITDKNTLREGSIKRRKPEIGKLQALGYQPKISLDEGLRRMLCQ